jgi:hypothetical protein
LPSRVSTPPRSNLAGIPRSTIREWLVRARHNLSDDIRHLFCRTCRQLGIEYTHNRLKEISIARRHSVGLVDSFVGPKA